jgi:hypothetical protein
MRWLSMALLLLTAGPSFAAEPFARVEIEDKGQIVPGQQVRVDVTVFAPDFFTSPPQFPLFDLPNAVVTLPDERAQNSSETEDGTQYSGIRRVYAIVPERSGTFTLPSIAIELGYSVDGKPVRGQATLPAFEFTVGEGSPSSGTTLAFAASQLTLSQSFDRDPAALKVGDAIVRTITVFAENTQAMMIPSVDVGNAMGMRQYATTSKIEDNVSFDRKVGSRRMQTVTYTIDAAGSFVIPDVSYTWYDIDERRRSLATLPSSKVVAVSAPLPAEAIIPQPHADADAPLPWPKLAVAAAILVLAAASGWLLWRLRPWLSQRGNDWLEAYRNSDRKALSSLRETISTGTPFDIEAGLRQWSRKLGYRSLAEWTAHHAALRGEVEILQRFLYGADASGIVVDRDGLMKAVSASGKTKAVWRPDRCHLPRLNPEGPGSARAAALRSLETGRSASRHPQQTTLSQGSRQFS